MLRTFFLDGYRSIGTGLTRLDPSDSHTPVIKLDLLSEDDIKRVVQETNPQVIIHCAANRFPDSCTADPEGARRINVKASRALAEAAIASGAMLIYISTDYVFSGRPGEAPYTASSKPDPPNV